jgi:hypothetical protein
MNRTAHRIGRRGVVLFLCAGLVPLLVRVEAGVLPAMNDRPCDGFVSVAECVPASGPNAVEFPGRHAWQTFGKLDAAACRFLDPVDDAWITPGMGVIVTAASLDVPTFGRPSSSAGDALAAVGRRWVISAKALLWEIRLACQPTPDKAADLMPALKGIFADEGVAPELAWIAEVESSFDSEAESPSGALGLFQFMPSTATRFGLQTGLSDERISPEKSARAAARYLKTLHQQFGSWSLAVAAYNAGEGCVRRALKTHQARTFDEIVVHLPLQTQWYVPKVMATLSRRENVDLSALPPPSRLHDG